MTDRPSCACNFQGRLDTPEHRAHHRAWETRQAELGQAVPSNSDLVDLYRRLDELVAWAHGGPLPALTVGAQARLTIAAKEKRS